jgi:hypothetical protein
MRGGSLNGRLDARALALVKLGSEERALLSARLTAGSSARSTLRV